jgi:hypothetical protein
MALIYLYQGRGIAKNITILDGAGTVITPGDSDQIRAIVGRGGKLNADLSGALLVIRSDLPSVGGSTFTKNDPSHGINQLEISPGDSAALFPGIYTLFIDLQDSADQYKWKNVSRQVLCVERT